MSRNVVHNAFAALALAAAAPAQAADEAAASVGTWRLNLAESIPPQGKQFRPFTVVIRSSGDVLDFTQTEAGADGQPRSFNHRTQTDGVIRDVPGYPGARMAMLRLPSGVIDARFWFPNGSLQNKFCLLDNTLRRQVCLATITAPGGEVTFFKHVLDRVD